MSDNEYLTLSKIALDYDSASRDGIGFDRLAKHVVSDPDVLGYMSQQRAAGIIAATSAMPRSAHGEMLIVAGSWLDGFLIGARFQKLQIERAAADDTQQ